MQNGKFVISLDFELQWGVRDKKTIQEYGSNILGVHKAIPLLLEIFTEYNINATFSTVGFIFFENRKELLDNLPQQLPQYQNQVLSPYIECFDKAVDDFENDAYYFAPNLIKLIQQYPNQEIGTHTFSHYYCLEEGQTINDFKADIEKAIEIAAKYNIQLNSLVFPRNQFNDAYLNVCSNLGIKCYRGNEHSWLYTARNGEKESLFRRSLRLIDAYINISGHNCYADEYLKSKFPMDIPSSRFLRPFSKKLKILDHLRLKRITTGMTYAAKNNLMYHLWWHPHNFGMNQNENFDFLKMILNHYQYLNKEYNFKSYTMAALAKSLI